MDRDVLVLCMNPNWRHFYGVLSGEPMAYYLYAKRNNEKVFFSTGYAPWGDLQRENRIKYGYIYNDEKIRWYFRLLKTYRKFEDIPYSERIYVPPFRRYYEHGRWYLLTDIKRLSGDYLYQISTTITRDRFRYLTNFQYLVRKTGQITDLRTNYLNAAICQSTFSPPNEQDFEDDIHDPISHIVRTDLQNARLHESTIERAFVLKLLERGSYPVNGKSENIDWLAEQPVFFERKRYDLVFRLKDSQRYVTVEFKRGDHEKEMEAVDQLAQYIQEIRKDPKIRDSVILPRIVCEHRSEDLVNKAKKILGPLVEVEEYHLNIYFDHEAIKQT